MVMVFAAGMLQHLKLKYSSQSVIVPHIDICCWYLVLLILLFK